MNHTHSEPIAPEDILAFVGGDAPPHIAALIRACPACAAQAQEYAATERGLRQSLYRFDCPPPQQLGDYQLGWLPTAERVAIATHLRVCPHCSAELHTLRAFMAEDIAIDVTLVERARRIIATLIPPRPQGALLGVRGVVDGDQRLYEAEDLVVALDITAARSASRGAINGLVYTVGDEEPLWAGRSVRLAPTTEHERVTQLDEAGGFALDQLPSGVYTLEVELADCTLVIPEVRVR